MSSMVNADACEREPIRIPGRIQSHGILLVINPATLLIEQASANASVWFSCSVDAVINSPLQQWVSDVGDVLSSYIAVLEPGQVRWLRLTNKQSNDVYDGCFHRTQEHCILEVERSEASEAQNILREQRELENSLTHLQDAPGLAALCSRITVEVQKVTGFDRVMVYRFDAEWNGAVVAETLNPGLTSYLGHHFPASDIPAQARATFLDSRVRMIAQVDFVPSALCPELNPTTASPVDLTCAITRSPSPIHLEYLRNMGVEATLTISLVSAGRLWGLIACHHLVPRFVSYGRRSACALIGIFSSGLLVAKEEAEDVLDSERLQKINDKLMEAMRKSEDLVYGLVRFSPNLLDLTNSEGAAVALIFEGKWTLIGHVPPLEYINRIVSWLNVAHPTTDVFITDNLTAYFADAAEFAHVASGLMMISIPKVQRNYILCFRPEVARTIEWAGQPTKFAAISDPLTLHPRQSFKTWREVVRGKSTPWKAYEVRAAHALRKAIIELDLTRQVNKERTARTESEIEKQRFAFLAEAGAVLGASLERDFNLREFARLAVERIADWVVIYGRDPQTGPFERLHVHHKTSQGAAIAADIQAFAGLDRFAKSPVSAVFRDAQPVLMSRVNTRWLKQIHESESYCAFVSQRLGMRSVIIVPVVIRGAIVGAVKLVRSEDTRRFTRADVELAASLSQRLASALDNAELYTQAQQAIQAREQVMGVVSHDLRNPLGAVTLNAQRLRHRLRKITEGPLDERMDSILLLVDKSCKRMSALIDNILNVAKIDAHQMRVELAPVDLGALLRDAVDMLEPIATQRGVHLALEAATVDRVACEAERVMQVLSNLIGNAIKFSPAGGRVTIRAGEDAQHCQVTVADEGPGIPPDHLVHVFDRFWQAQQTDKRGAGLGLSIAKGIVEAHGGRIWVESYVGKGSLFHFTLYRASVMLEVSAKNLGADPL